MSVIEFSTAQNVRDQIWSALLEEAKEFADQERALSSLFYASILNQESFCRALASHLAEKLATPEVSALHLRKLFLDLYREDGSIVDAAAQDLIAVRERDRAPIRIELQNPAVADRHAANITRQVAQRRLATVQGRLR